MQRGDIYNADLDPVEGREQRGRRPVLIVSTSDFNRLTQLPVIVPITMGGEFARVAGLTVSLMGLGLRTEGVVRCDQPRVLDLAARGARKIETVPPEIVDEVLAKLVSIFE